MAADLTITLDVTGQVNERTAADVAAALPSHPGYAHDPPLVVVNAGRVRGVARLDSDSSFDLTTTEWFVLTRDGNQILDDGSIADIRWIEFRRDRVRDHLTDRALDLVTGGSATAHEMNVQLGLTQAISTQLARPQIAPQQDPKQMLGHENENATHLSKRGTLSCSGRSTVH